MARKHIKTEKFEAGYEVRHEELSGEDAGGGDPFIMPSAFTPDGDYIGSPDTAHFLIVKKGIKPQARKPACSSANGGFGRTCSIGLCEREQQWYGWSHRAIFGFSIGDVVKKGDCCASSGWTDEYLAEHPEEDLSLPVGFLAESLDDCKRMAIAFADSVS